MALEVDITAAQVDEESPGDETLMESVRLDLYGLDTRVSTLEDAPNVVAFSHFVQRHGNSPTLLTTGGVDGAYESDLRNEPFGLTLSAAAAAGDQPAISMVQRIASAADEHTLRIDMASAFPVDSSTNHLWGAIYAKPVMVFNNRVAPIVFLARLKLATATSRNFYCGLLPFLVPGTNIAASLTAGIFLKRTGANWCFTRGTGGAFTDGSNITPQADATWFQVKIEYDTAPGTQARCYLRKEGTDSDYVWLETFTTSLPAADALLGTIATMATNADGSTDLDADRLKISAGGALGEAA